jgi:type VI secretion system secreted protein Hcp
MRRKALLCVLVAGVLVLLAGCASGVSQEQGPGLSEQPGETEDIGGATPLAYDMYLKIGGIAGEAIAAGHEDWIEIESYSYEVVGATPAAGLLSGKPDLGEFIIVKLMDKSSPKLFEYCCSGKQIQEVKLELCEAGGSQNVFARYILREVILKSYDSASPKLFKEWDTSSPKLFSFAPGEGTDDTVTKPIEVVSFSYAKIQMEYINQSGQTAAGWDITANNKY